MTKWITPWRGWATVVLTVAVAFLSGHLMQSDHSETAATQPVITPRDLPKPPVTAGALPIPPSLQDRILETRADRGGTCDVDLALTETPAGLLSVTLNAPCHANSELLLRLNELTANVVTNARGNWGHRLPVLSDVSTVEITLADVTVSGRLRHQSVSGQQHIILAWTGTQTFQIGVDPRFGDTVARQVIDEEIGAFIRVGDGTGAAFEIYTFPAANSRSAGVLRVSVDAEITLENCGKTARTRAYQTGYLGTLRPTEIAYTMPDCDRAGDVVRLQNLFRDLRLAQR